MQSRPKMTLLQRAKQFMPFAALRGFQELLQEVARYREEKKELSADQLEVLDRELRRIPLGRNIAVLYYDGRTYTRYTGILRKVDEVRHTLYVGDKEIPVSQILRITEVESRSP